MNLSFEDISTIREGTRPLGLMARYDEDNCSDLEMSMVWYVKGMDFRCDAIRMRAEQPDRGAV